MNIKNICKIIGTTTAMLSVLVLAGVINSAPSQAAEKILQVDEEVTTSSAVSLNESKKNDYTIDVNASVEKEGFKLTIKNVTATKHNLKVVALIESSKLLSYDKESSHRDILQMTVMNAESESYGWDQRKIDDNKMEYTFNIDSLKGFNDNTQLRFDALLPQYDLNAWVDTTVDISKYLDKISQSDIKFSFGDYDFYKSEADISGISLYYKENEQNDFSDDSYENQTWDSQSKILLKFNDKLYEVSEKNSFFDDDTIIGYYRTEGLSIDDIKVDSELSIIPVKCNITNGERDRIFDSEISSDNDTESEENNVIYNKEFNFKDNSKATVSKVERTDDKVKLYISSTSDKNSLLMALSMNGYYDFVKEDNDIDDYHDINKIIYKNPDDKSGYIVEFNNVKKDKKIRISNHSFGLSYNDKFDIGEEIKIN